MLPDGLQNLTFGSNFNQTLANVKWPSNLQSLVVHEVFCQQLDVSLPSSLQSLDCMGLKASFTWNRWHLLAADPSCVTGWIFKTSKMAIWFHFETDDKSLHLDDHNTRCPWGEQEMTRLTCLKLKEGPMLHLKSWAKDHGKRWGTLGTVLWCLVALWNSSGTCFLTAAIGRGCSWH